MTQIDRLIQTAVGELGYTESSDGYTKYGNWYGMMNGYGDYTKDETNYFATADWCVTFVSWCANQAGISNTIIPRMAACVPILEWFESNGRRTSANEPAKPGDLILYEWDWDSSAGIADGVDHIGIVESVSSDNADTQQLTVIEGNKGGIEVGRRVISYRDPQVWAICRPAYLDSDEPLEGIRYIVQEGDTLNDIAARYGTTAQAIADYNGISDVNLIYVGQVLYIPTGSSQSYTTYIVKSGDSLGRIAVSYGLMVAEVAAFNSISDPDTIYVGQEIKIPVSGRRDYIRMFQQAVCDAGVAQITVDGIWGSETASVAVYAEVEKGTMGPLATFAQTMLVAYGYSLPNSGIDGDFWTESVNATIQYQQDHGLVADGIIGIATWKDMLQVA